MATNTPQLEQLTGSIDALPHSLDSLDALPWSNPTLEQLDAWGNLDFLDALGNMDNLSSLAVLIAPPHRPASPLPLRQSCNSSSLWMGLQALPSQRQQTFSVSFSTMPRLTQLSPSLALQRPCDRSMVRSIRPSQKPQ